MFFRVGSFFSTNFSIGTYHKVFQFKMSLNYLFEMNEQNCSKTSIYIIGYTDYL